MFAAILALSLLIGGVAWQQHSPTSVGQNPTEPAAAALTNPTAIVATPTSGTVPFSAYLQSTVAQQAGNLPLATRSIITALADDPGHTPLTQQALAASLLLGDVPTAIRLAHTISPTQQTFLSALTLTAEAIQQNNPKAALRFLAQAAPPKAHIPPIDWLTAHLTAALNTTTNQPLASRAVPSLAAGLQARRLPSALHSAQAEHLARLWLAANAPDKALRALMANPNDQQDLWPTLLELTLLQTSGQTAAAAALHRSFVAANPTTALLLPTPDDLTSTSPTVSPMLVNHAAAALRDLALILWQQQANAPTQQAARQVFQLALYLEPATSPDWPRYAYVLGMLEEAADNFAAAQALYTRAAQSPAATPGLILATRLRTLEITYRQQSTRGARLVAEAESLAAAHPTTPAVLHTLAALAQAQHDYPRAYAAYTGLLKTLTPEAPAALAEHLQFAQGAAAERMGNDAEAEHIFQTLLAQNPAHAQALNYLGYMWVLQGKNLPAAYAMLRRALLLAPNDGAITDSVGWAYYAKGDYPTALTYLLRAAELEPDDPTIADHLGDTYAKLNQPDDARLQWQRALELLPANQPEPEPGFTRAVQRKLKGL
jgi:tetratricopeptide (TPR) repeat protein